MRQTGALPAGRSIIVDQDLMARFVGVVAAHAARGFETVRVESVRYRPMEFEIVVKIRGRKEELVLRQSEVEDCIANNSLVLELERQLLSAGAVPNYEP